MPELIIGNTLYSEQFLPEGVSLKANGANYLAKMQGDGNFVLYDNGTPIWASQTGGVGKGPFSLKAQSDANVCVYQSNGQATWSSNSYGKGPALLKLVLQDDRNLVLYDSTGKPIWHTNTVK